MTFMTLRVITRVCKKSGLNVYFEETKKNSNSHTSDHVKFQMTFLNVTLRLRDLKEFRLLKSLFFEDLGSLLLMI
jgi:hypothetical protein